MAKFIERYKEKCGTFEISSSVEDDICKIYIHTERFIAKTLFSKETKFDDFPDEIKDLYKVTFLDPIVMEKFGPGTPESVEKFEERVNLQSFRASLGYPFCGFVVLDKENDNVVGYEEIANDSESNPVAVAYLFSKDYQRSSGKKYVGYENVGALIYGYGVKLYNENVLVNSSYNKKSHKFEGWSIFSTVYATARTDNYASQSILTNLGFSHISTTSEIYEARHMYQLNYDNIFGLAEKQVHSALLEHTLLSGLASDVSTITDTWT